MYIGANSITYSRSGLRMMWSTPVAIARVQHLPAQLRWQDLLHSISSIFSFLDVQVSRKLSQIHDAHELNDIVSDDVLTQFFINS